MNASDSSNDTPAWLVVAGLGLALLSLGMISYGTFKTPPRDSLEMMTGTVSGSYKKCKGLFCQVSIGLSTSNDQNWARQDDYAGNPPVLAAGIKIVALVSHDPATNQLRFWELRRGSAILFSYDDSSAGAELHYRRCGVIGDVAAFVAAVLLLAGIWMGIRNGVWRQ
jgi:hypothetical protein